MATREEIRAAIIKANKWGAKGIQIVDYIEPWLATQAPDLLLITQIPRIGNASETAWYDK